VAVYTEVDRRAVQIPLTRAVARGEQLEIVLKDDDNKPGTVLSTLTYTVQ
jgi:hypothetical protein